MQKNRDMKDSVRAWQQYADRQKPNQKLKRATSPAEGPSRLSILPQAEESPPHMPSSPRSVSTVRTPLLRADRGRLSPPGVLLTWSGARNEAAAHDDAEQSPYASVTPKGPIATSSDAVQGAARGRSQTETTGAPSSSQTTVDEYADQSHRRTQAVDLEDEDDLPQVVSERSLKRKRGQQPRIDIYTGRFSDGTPAKPHRVKDEPLSSPPPAMYALMRTETMDLDDPVPLGLEANRSPTNTHLNTSGAFRHHRSSSAPFSQSTKREITQNNDRGIDQVFNVRLQVAAAELRALSEPTDPLLDDQQVLQPLDPNIVQRTPGHSSNKRLKQIEARRTEHSTLAESGEAFPTLDESESRVPPSVARARLNQRMRATKNPQTPANRLQHNPSSGSPLVKQEQLSTSPDSTPRPIQTSSGSSGMRRSTSNARIIQQDDIIPDGRPVWSMRAPEMRFSPQQRSTSPSARRSRLRTKPVKELRLHDFKPNPVYNQGYTYAFSEAVRKRSDRLCLPGCTNPQCCGSTFRGLAEALDPLHAQQEEALLEEYLGDAYSTVVCTQMSFDERAELVLQARTKKMAKDAGKHREAYERRRTPQASGASTFLPHRSKRTIDCGLRSRRSKSCKSDGLKRIRKAASGSSGMSNTRCRAVLKTLYRMCV